LINELLTRGMFMTHFSVGEQVIIRWGLHQGQKAKIIKTLLADGYKVKIQDGSIRFFSSKGLEKQKAEVQEAT